MSSFFPRRRRQPFNQFGMGGWSQSPAFFGGGMHPLEQLFSNFSNFNRNFMPPMHYMSNIIDPFLDQLMRRNLRWIEQPTRALKPQQRRGQKALPVQRQRTRTPLPVQKRPTQQVHVQKETGGRKLGALGGAKMPQKYRIVIGCTGVSPSALKTQVKCVGEQRHLIVSGQQCGKGLQCAQFKRSFTLPPQVDTKKMCKCVTPMGSFCVEFPFLEAPTSLGIQLRPQICKTAEGHVVMVRVLIPEFVDPAKVQLQLKGKEIIVRFEERLVNCDCVQRVFYYNRVVLPEGVNVSQLKAKSDKHRLIITAPVRTLGMDISKGLRTIPIQRKLRQRQGVKAVSPERKKISGGGIEKKKKEQQLPVTTTQKKKQIAPTTTTGGAEKKKTLPSKPSGTNLGEQAQITSTSKKGISTEKKPILGSGEQKSPITTEKKSKKKSTSTQEGQKGQKGSDILKKVFGTEQSGSQGTKQGTKKESSPQRQDVGEVLSGFQSSSSGVKSGSEGRQQK